MTEQTDIHGWPIPVPDETTGWGIVLNALLDGDLDRQVIHYDIESNRPPAGPDGPILFFATDAQRIDYNDGNQWHDDAVGVADTHTFVTVADESASLSNAEQHSALTGADLHAPAAHAASHESGGTDAITHNNLALNSDDHHIRYTDTEAVDAVENESPLTLSGAVQFQSDANFDDDIELEFGAGDDVRVFYDSASDELAFVDSLGSALFKINATSGNADFQQGSLTVSSGNAAADGFVTNNGLVYTENTIDTGSQTSIRLFDSTAAADLVEHNEGGPSQFHQDITDTAGNTVYDQTNNRIGTDRVTATSVTLGDGLEDDGTDSITVEEPFVYDPGMSNWEDALSSEEVNRIVLQAGETLVVDRIEFRQKGGGSSTSADIEVFDSTAAAAIGSQTLGGTTKNPGSSGSGNTVLVRLTNSTGAAIDAAPRVTGRIQGA